VFSGPVSQKGRTKNDIPRRGSHFTRIVGNRNTIGEQTNSRPGKNDLLIQRLGHRDPVDPKQGLVICF